jgi:hypothetical protein
VEALPSEAVFEENFPIYLPEDELERESTNQTAALLFYEIANPENT